MSGSSTSSKKNPSIDIEADLLDQKELGSVKSSAENLLLKISNCESVEGGWDICDAIWPAYKMKADKTQPKLILLPLSRLGASQGYSGSHVMVGYFIDAGETGLFPSRPMIVKLLRHEKGTFQDKLKEEMNNAQDVKIFIAYHKDSFAVPLHFDSLDDHSILWSPFSSNKWTLEAYQQSKGSRLSLALDDLMTHLRSNGGNGIAENIINTVFRLLMPLHLSAGTANSQERKLVEEYELYLRKIHDGWGDEWRNRVWAPETQMKVLDLNREWVNPFWVLAMLRKASPVSLYCGAIHGDLHPRNIVLSDNNSAHIIDFGWTTNDAHIAKDFVLLECNLRSVALKPNVSYEAMETMAAWLDFKTKPPELGLDYCDRRLKLIQQVRCVAKTHFPSGTDWDNEYLIPLFLVSLGLLKHLRDYDNQIAARFTVLSLANYVAGKFVVN